MSKEDFKNMQWQYCKLDWSVGDNFIAVSCIRSLRTK